MQPAEGDSAAMRRKQTLEYFTRALQEVQASNEAFRVLKTVSAQPTRGSGSNSNIDSNGSGSGSVTSNRSSNPLVILDSSFNPPTVAHAQMATSALNAEPPDSRLMLLLAVNNADKKPVPAAFPHRLGMMEGFARDILSSGDVRDRGGGVQIDLAVTTEAFFHAKASSIAGSGRYGGPSRFLFLCGFDTVVRIFDPAYYAAAEEAGRSGQRAAMRAALGPFFDRARLRVTMRPGDDDDDGWGGAQDQVAYVEGLRAGGLEAMGGDAAWGRRLELVEGVGGAVSSSSVRASRRRGGDGAGELDGVGDEVRAWIEGEGLYRDG